jgi:hypothetical protein
MNQWSRVRQALIAMRWIAKAGLVLYGIVASQPWAVVSAIAIATVSALYSAIVTARSKKHPVYY